MKIAVVGGGSTYTPELVDGLLRRADALDVHEIALVDPDRARLAVVGPLAQRMAERVAPGAPVRITCTDDLAGGVRGATFVVSQIRVGGMAARHRDELLGREFGLIGQETVGVGGFANGLRTIPVALRIAEVVAAEAPGATLFNFTNPAGLITEALCRHGAMPAIGLCNVPWSQRAMVAKGLDVSIDAVELDTVGLNHLTWVRAVRVDGVDRTADAIAVARSRAERASDGAPRFTPESIDLLAAIPNPYLLYYYETEACLARQAANPTRASEVMALEEQLLAEYADPLLDTKPPSLAGRGGAFYSEAAAALMGDIASGATACHVVNVPHGGAVPGLTDDVVLEITTEVRAGVVTPKPVEALRADVDALVRTVKDVELLAVEAAVHGDEEAAMQALLAHPLGPSAALVPAVWRRLQEVHAGLLGRLERR